MSKSAGSFDFDFDTAGSYSMNNWLENKKYHKFKGLIIEETYDSNGLTDVVTHVKGTAVSQEQLTSLENILGKKD